jgi:HPt (histidine-containing phosphotransfer) domain-containing protein
MSELYLDEVLFEELRSILDTEFPTLINTYVQDSAARVDDLRTAFAAGNADAVRKSAHSLKGASANLGLVYLAELCREMEEAAREDRLAGQEARLLQIQQERERGVEILRERL